MPNNTYFCDDIVFQILSRLPPKSLFRFRCVSSPWCSLIDNKFLPWRALPCKLLGFLHQTKQAISLRREIGLIKLHASDVDDDDELVDTALSFLPQPRSFIIDSSSNGLFLCHDSMSADCYFYYICNPATRIWANVPTLNDNWEWERAYMFLAYDPCNTSPYSKILRICRNRPYFRLYSSEKGCWGDIRVLNLPIHQEIGLDSFENCSTTCHKGALYLNARTRVLIFDLAEETFRCVVMPYNSVTCFLGKLGGFVCCAYTSILFNGVIELSIWMLDACSNSYQWKLKHEKNLPGSARILGFFPKPDTARILGFHPNSDVVFLRIDTSAFAYDLEKKELEILGLLTPNIKREDIFPYSPCWLDDWRTGGQKI